MGFYGQFLFNFFSNETSLVRTIYGFGRHILWQTRQGKPYSIFVQAKQMSCKWLYNNYHFHGIFNEWVPKVWMIRDILQKNKIVIHEMLKVKVDLVCLGWGGVS